MHLVQQAGSFRATCAGTQSQHGAGQKNIETEFFHGDDLELKLLGCSAVELGPQNTNVFLQSVGYGLRFGRASLRLR